MQCLDLAIDNIFVEQEGRIHLTATASQQLRELNRKHSVLVSKESCRLSCKGDIGRLQFWKV